MAFKKDTNDSTIVFAYTRDLLFGGVSLISTYKSRNIRDQEGRYIGEPYALSGDELDAFNVCIENVVPDIYDSVMKITSRPVDAFSIVGDILFKIMDNKGYNENVLKNVDVSLQNTIICGILKEWYGLCANVDFHEEYAGMYEKSLNLLRDKLFQLRKKALE